jgi:hypothetical protein
MKTTLAMLTGARNYGFAELNMTKKKRVHNQTYRKPFIFHGASVSAATYFWGPLFMTLLAQPLEDQRS